ncbi:hypothetical protein [Burkholderia anthina]|uniref:hypothetical protein n=1 Tax=Burkholderia anthina TaxID=179879 RepID=UPI001588C7A7|nr:hypothetical protein [Burkholderia anthina]
MLDAARETIAHAVKARNEYAQFDEDRWAAAANPFEAWADYSARIPERNARRAAIKDAEAALHALTSRRSHSAIEEGEMA